MDQSTWHPLRQLVTSLPAWRTSLRTILAVGTLSLLAGWFISRSAPVFDGFGDGADRELGIRELITSVQQELQESERERVRLNEAALFRVKSFDLEVNFTIQHQSRGSAQGTYHFVAVTSESAVQQARTHRLVLRMEAADVESGFVPATIPPVDAGSGTPVQTHGPAPPPAPERPD